MVMMDQYKQETSQIHAPADLIRRTKEAMHEEELRLQQGSDRPSVLRFGKIYRWALPVAAAAAVFLAINAAAIMVGSRLGKSSSDTAMENAMDEGAAYDTAAAAAEEPAEYEAADMAPAEQESSAGAAPDRKTELYANKQAEADAYDGGAGTMTDDFAFSENVAEACEEESAQEAATEEKASPDTEAGAGGIDPADLSVTKVMETPAFVDDADTMCVMVQGIRVYVAREADDQWSAYARVGQVNYMVTGGANIAEAEDFAAEAYALITETAENE